MIGVIDYKAGNAPSVLNALKHLNVPSTLISSSDDINKLTGIILPGVGSAQATIDSLKEMDCFNIIEEKVLRYKMPFLGICIGLQVLFDYSDEGNVECLGWVPGKVKRFSEDKVRVPQIGWNEVKFVNEDRIALSLKQSEFFYFVNSYYVEPDDQGIILAKTHYDKEFCSMIKYENIYAAQFHIEKSGPVGLKLLENFVKITKMEGSKEC